MLNKTFSDFEKMFIEQNKDKTFGELLDSCHDPNVYPSTDPNTHLGLHYTVVSLSYVDSILFKLKKDFFMFAASQKGFLDLPILGDIYDEDADGIMYAVQNLFDDVYKVLYYDFSKCCFMTSYYKTNHVANALMPSSYKTIGDLYLDLKARLAD